MRAYDFETLDVFTDQKFAGNPLAVVMNGEGLSDEEMQTITREFNLSETTFVLPPENPDHTARVRIFTLGYEMPFAGHPTVGASIAIAKARGLTGDLMLELNAGLFPVRVDISGEAAFAEFQNPNLPEEIGAAPSADALEATLSLPAGSLDRDAARPRIISAGVPYLCACADLDIVRKAQVRRDAFEDLGIDETVGVYLYARGGETPEANFHARMFDPHAGILEDPATGSAASALPGQIALSEELDDGEHCWVIEQGYEMGRPSRIMARVETNGGKIRSVRIGGNAVPMQRGRLFL